jgi:hypothetical protein
MQESAAKLGMRTEMTAEERYLLDVQGYVVIPDALSAAELSALNVIMDEKVAAEVEPQAIKHRFGLNKLLDWGKPYRQLIDHPSIMPCVRGLVGTPRLDHDYADIIRCGGGPIGSTLHGGGAVSSFSCSYTFAGGRSRCGLIAVAFNLHDVNPGDGGFGAVPGSHKANLPIPSPWLELGEQHPCARPVTGPAGTAIVFSEALTHGTMPWRARHERRTLFFKYSPAPLSWSPDYYNADAYPDLTQQQRDLLRPPYDR